MIKKVGILMCIEETATITPNGIEFNNQFYSCSRAIREQWFGPSMMVGKRIPIFYYPDDTTIIIVNHSEDREICRLVNKIHYDGERLLEYYKAMDCLKLARRKFNTIGKRCYLGGIWK